MGNNKWNACLLYGVAQGFLKAIETLNKRVPLRYSWIRYIPTDLPQSSLSELQTRIKALMKAEPILYSRLSTLKKPHELTYTPPEYIDRSGTPLVGTSCSYLSSKYDWSIDSGILLSLGVHVLDRETFLKQIGAMFRNSFGKSVVKDESWHEDLAIVLDELPSSYFKSHICHFPIIPLGDGSWITYNQSLGKVFLDGQANLKVPGGLKLRLVCATAMTSSPRVRLFEKLGMRYCSPVEVSKMILELHSASPDGISTIPYSKEHILYLFETYSELFVLQYGSLWLLDVEGKPAKARDLYIEAAGEEKDGVSMKDDPSCLRYINSGYIRLLSEDKHPDWLVWLVNVVGVSSRPKLIEHAELSSAFRSVVSRYNSPVWLRCLLEGTFTTTAISNLPTYALEQISQLPVMCENGSTVLLRDTMLPSEEILAALTKYGVRLLPILKLDDPSIPGWIQLLGPFHVVTAVDIEFYVWLLHHYKKEGTNDRKHIRKVYLEIASLNDVHAVRSCFTVTPLIFVTRANESRWVKGSVCVWKAPHGTQYKIPLDEQWPDLEEFFRSTLKIGNADLTMTINELKMYSKSPEDERNARRLYVQDILLYLAEFSRSTAYEGLVKKLVHDRIFPVRGTSQRQGLNSSRAEFFIADRVHLQDCFEGLIWQLDLAISDIHKLSTARIFQLLDMEDKFLSKQVKEESDPIGTPLLHQPLTLDYGHKVITLLR